MKEFITKEKKDNIKQFLPQYLKDYHDIDVSNMSCCSSSNFSCPIHNDKTPSAKYYEDSNKVYCFGCARDYDIFDLYAFDNNLDIKKDFYNIYKDLVEIYKNDNRFLQNTLQKQINYKQALKIKESKHNEILEDFTSYYNNCSLNIYKTDYLIKRGISYKVQKLYKIGYDVERNFIIMPIDENHYVRRSASFYAKFYTPVPKAKIFNYTNINNFYKTVFVCESIIDVLSLKQIQLDYNLYDIHAVALNSTNNFKQLIDLIKDNKYNGKLVLALDNDESGRKTTKLLIDEIELLKKEPIYSNLSYNVLKFTNKEKEDINNVLLNNKEYLARQVNQYLSYEDTLNAKIKRVIT